MAAILDDNVGLSLCENFRGERASLFGVMVQSLAPIGRYFHLLFMLSYILGGLSASRVAADSLLKVHFSCSLYRGMGWPPGGALCV